MYYYQRQLGDYAAATRHLSILEHGVYTLMLDAYYLNESPLPADMGKLCRLIGARNEDEKNAVQVIADEFFTKEGEFFIQTRCDNEIKKYHAKSDSARKSAQARWNSKENEQENQSVNANALPTEVERNANQEPITKNHSIKSPSGATIEDVVAVYHETLPNLPAVRMMDAKRKAVLKSRQREYPKANDIAWWEVFFNLAGQSKFLMGDVQGERAWRADFDFLLSPKGFKGVIEGKYQ